MWLIARGKLILIYLLLTGSTIWTRSITDEEPKIEVITSEPDSQEGEVIRVTYDDPGTTELPIQNLTTKSPLRIIEIYATQAPIENVKVVNETNDFKPSLHLGEIGEASVSTGLFNTVHHVQFENNITPKHRGQLNNIALSAQPTVQTFVQESTHVLGNVSRQVADHKDFQGGQVKFEDGASYVLEDSGIRYEDAPTYNTQVKPIHENLDPHYEVVEHQLFQNLENPVHAHVAILGKPVKFQALPQNYVHGTATSFEGSPYQGVHDYNHYQPALQDYQAKPPGSNVVYVHQQESSFTRTHKFPYSFYQAPIGYQEFSFFGDHHLSPQFRRRRISPWKKLVHLIGAFLPFGLLLATLTPNLVKVGNTTQSNIVLSKLRVADLPMQHKSARLVDEGEKECEDRSMCEMILSGGQTGSNLMQNILWNIAVRTSKKAATENGLEEIFSAAKSKDCSRIVC